jgi:hypothetical protein
MILFAWAIVDIARWTIARSGAVRKTRRYAPRNFSVVAALQSSRDRPSGSRPE